MRTLSNELPPPQTAALLASTPLFGPLTDEQRLEIARRAQLVTVEVGGAIVREGEETTELFVLLQGEAIVTIGMGDGDERLEVRTLQPGSTLGELALLLGEPRSASVTAEQPCTLLRFDRATFHRLLEEIPGLGLALSQELARRFRAALDENNEMQGEHYLAPRPVERSDLSQMRAYMTQYYTAAMRGVLRRHQLLVNGEFPRYTDTLSLTAEEQARWFSLFDVQSTEADTPFTYYTISGSMAMMQMLRQLGVNFRYLMHLRSEMFFSPAVPVVQPGEDYRCTFQINDLIQLRTDRVAMVTRTEINDSAGRVVALIKDFWIIMNLAPEYVAAIRRAGSKRLGRHDASQFQSMSRRKSRFADASVRGDGVHEREIFVPADMGMAYGRLSGDLNMMHTTAVGARAFGFPKPFIQGQCTSNYVLKALTGASGAAPSRFHISFSNRAYVDQTLRLYFDAESFEVCDERGVLLAFGEWAPRTTVDAPAPAPAVTA